MALLQISQQTALQQMMVARSRLPRQRVAMSTLPQYLVVRSILPRHRVARSTLPGHLVARSILPRPTRFIVQTPTCSLSTWSLEPQRRTNLLEKVRLKARHAATRSRAISANLTMSRALHSMRAIAIWSKQECSKDKGTSSSGVDSCMMPAKRIQRLCTSCHRRRRRIEQFCSQTEQLVSKRWNDGTRRWQTASLRLIWTLHTPRPTAGGAWPLRLSENGMMHWKISTRQ
mmetsp:Transcript_62504/g.165868  ORF Transcript_62504/g.165868 Transcript_62504/m.165868 type:complete len:230 (+) Transcript_62504:262-951(+)